MYPDEKKPEYGAGPSTHQTIPQIQQCQGEASTQDVPDGDPPPYTPLHSSGPPIYPFPPSEQNYTPSSFLTHHPRPASTHPVSPGQDCTQSSFFATQPGPAFTHPIPAYERPKTQISCNFCSHFPRPGILPSTLLGNYSYHSDEFVHHPNCETLRYGGGHYATPQLRNQPLISPGGYVASGYLQYPEHQYLTTPPIFLAPPARNYLDGSIPEQEDEETRSEILQRASHDAKESIASDLKSITGSLKKLFQ